MKDFQVFKVLLAFNDGRYELGGLGTWKLESDRHPFQENHISAEDSLSVPGFKNPEPLG
jgi:hypothetical protein